MFVQAPIHKIHHLAEAHPVDEVPRRPAGDQGQGESRPALFRFGLQEQVIGLAEKFNIPIATTIMDKSLIPESHPKYIGVYEGALGHDSVCRYVESSDCVLLLGALLTDFNLGLFSAKLDPSKTIAVNIVILSENDIKFTWFIFSFNT